MKNSLKCVFELLDLVKKWENGTVFSEKSQYLKKCLYEPHTLSLTLCQSVRECPKILKNCQITKMDMGFQKKYVSGWSEDLDFFYRRVSRESQRTLKHNGLIIFLIKHNVLIIFYYHKPLFSIVWCTEYLTQGQEFGKIPDHLGLHCNSH